MALYALSSVFNVCCDSLYPLPSLWLPRISSPPTSGITTPPTCSRTSLLLLAIPLSCIILFYLLKYNYLCRRRQWHPTPVLLRGKSPGQRSLVGCSPWGCEESDMTERLHFHFSLSCIGEGNGNPLQCSCLQNPRDRWAWWAAIYAVAQSLTRLTWLSSSSSSSSGSVVKNLPTMQELQDTQVGSLGREDPLEVTHSSILAWRIPIDKGAWQATAYGVTKSWTWLKWLSSHATALFITVIFDHEGNLVHMHTETHRVLINLCFTWFFYSV